MDIELNQNNMREVKTKDWKDYPVGTKAFAVGGGYWERVKTGWKWCTGATFPTPGGDASGIIEMPQTLSTNNHKEI